MLDIILSVDNKANILHAILHIITCYSIYYSICWTPFSPFLSSHLILKNSKQHPHFTQGTSGREIKKFFKIVFQVVESKCKKKKKPLRLQGLYYQTLL